MDTVEVTETVVERPIDLTPFEVLALSQGASQLRRIVTLPKGTGAMYYYNRFPDRWHEDFRIASPARLSGWVFWSGSDEYPTPTPPETQEAYDAFTLRVYDHGFLCPFGRPGDRLWGRETWAAIWPDMDEVPLEECNIEYRAEGDPRRYPGNWPPEFVGDPEKPQWRRANTMPRFASRTLLKITSVKPVKLHSLTEEDAGREGFFDLADMQAAWDRQHCGPRIKRPSAAHLPWSANPWAWVIGFRALSAP